jgi:hypothetical protein
MYYGDHPPPHFHAAYGEHEAIIGIDSLAVIAGGLPARALGLVIEWAALRQQELLQAWQNVESLQEAPRIAPLS